MKDERLPKNMVVSPAGVKRRKGTKFIKEVEEMVRLKVFDNGILEIGESYVRFICEDDIEKEGERACQ